MCDIQAFRNDGTKIQRNLIYWQLFSLLGHNVRATQLKIYFASSFRRVQLTVGQFHGRWSMWRRLVYNVTTDRTKEIQPRTITEVGITFKGLPQETKQGLRLPLRPHTLKLYAL